MAATWSFVISSLVVINHMHWLSQPLQLLYKPQNGMFVAHMESQGKCETLTVPYVSCFSVAIGWACDRHPIFHDISEYSNTPTYSIWKVVLWWKRKKEKETRVAWLCPLSLTVLLMHRVNMEIVPGGEK